MESWLCPVVVLVVFALVANGKVVGLLVVAIGWLGLREELCAQLLVFVDCLQLSVSLLYCADEQTERYCPCCQSCEKLVGSVSRHVGW